MLSICSVESCVQADSFFCRPHVLRSHWSIMSLFLQLKIFIALLKEFARNDASSENADIDTGYVVTRKGFKKRVDKLDLSFMNYQDAFKSKSTMEVSENI